MPLEDAQHHEPPSPPPWFKIQSTLDLPTEKQPVIIEGLWRQGEVLLLGSHAKSWKSWNLMDLFFCVANGMPYLIWNKGTHSGKVLYIDMELTQATIRERFESIQASYGVGNLANIDILSLRGISEFKWKQFQQLKDHIESGKYTAIAFDPTYRLLAGSNMSENDTGVITELMNTATNLATSSKSGVALLQHFSKGEQSNKEAIDAFSGSGVWGRAPDNLLLYRQHEAEKSFTVTAYLRDCEGVDEFAVTYEKPRFKINATLDPDDLKKPAPRNQKKFTVDDLCRVIDDGENISFDILKRRLGWKKRTLERRINEAKTQNLVSLRVTDDTYFLTSSYLSKARNGHPF
jgi:hypothetical protein